MRRLLNNAKHWRGREGHARVLADQMNDPKARRTMLEIAKSYGRLAKLAEQRKAAEKQTDTESG